MGSEVIYYILNGDFVLGTCWKTEKLGVVLVIENKINLNFPIEVYGRDENAMITKISDIDVVNEFMEILNANLKKEKNETSD